MIRSKSITQRKKLNKQKNKFNISKAKLFWNPRLEPKEMALKLRWPRSSKTGPTASRKVCQEPMLKSYKEKAQGSPGGW